MQGYQEHEYYQYCCSTYQSSLVMPRTHGHTQGRPTIQMVGSVWMPPTRFSSLKITPALQEADTGYNIGCNTVGAGRSAYPYRKNGKQAGTRAYQDHGTQASRFGPVFPLSANNRANEQGDQDVLDVFRQQVINMDRILANTSY